MILQQWKRTGTSKSCDRAVVLKLDLPLGGKFWGNWPCWWFAKCSHTACHSNLLCSSPPSYHSPRLTSYLWSCVKQPACSLLLWTLTAQVSCRDLFWIFSNGLQRPWSCFISKHNSDYLSSNIRCWSGSSVLNECIVSSGLYIWALESIRRMQLEVVRLKIV